MIMEVEQKEVQSTNEQRFTFTGAYGKAIAVVNYNGLEQPFIKSFEYPEGEFHTVTTQTMTAGEILRLCDDMINDLDEQFELENTE